ncbi:MAG TPA: S8 family serine peptidase [Longimicrobium sp.]|nr:S8 family serine peptidase [Longimicrobium sp.]
MKRVAPLFMAGLVALAACSDNPAALADAASPSLNLEAGADGAGMYLVRFPETGIPADFAEQVAALGGEVIFAHAGARVGAVAGLSAQAADQLAGTGLQLAADANVQLDPMVGDVEAASVEGAAIAAETPYSPTNPAASFFYNRQWNMRAIQANAAWTAGKLGSSAIKVGILDTGLDYLHPDLYGRVDLNLSRSFLSATENARVQASFPGAHPVADLHYHGTHVGSTVSSNGLAAAGVTSRVTLVGLKVCHPGTAANGYRAGCPTSGTLSAILYAADNGIPVINMSLGSEFQRRDASASGGSGPSFIATINAVFNYAHDKGTTIVVSAGNSAYDMQHDKNGYKSYCDAPHVICVSSTGPASAPAHGTYSNVDQLASYSNFGGSVTVAAPGGAGRNGTPVNVGWVYAACSGFSFPVPNCRTRFYNPVTGAWSASVIGINGTSMASPHVAGVAALAAERVGTTPDAIRGAVIGTSDDLGKNGRDLFYGHGRVNAARAAGL